MKRFAFKSIKDLENEIMKNQSLELCENIKLINITQIHIIKYLFENEDREIYQKDFEELLKIRKSTISGILSTMEKNNIITRVSTKGEKCKLIKLTPKARKCKDEVLKKLEFIESELIEGIPESDMDTFFSVIDRMLANVKKKGTNKDVKND